MGLDPLTIAIGLGALSLVTQGAQSYTASKNASDQKREQKKQLALQRKVNLVTARREARIKAAQFAASSSSSGTSGSITEGVTAGLQTSLQSGMATADEQYAVQAKQFDIAADTTKQNAFFDFGQSVIGAGSSIYTAKQKNVFLPEEDD